MEECFFTPTGIKKTMNSNIWIECASTCTNFTNNCWCYGKSSCINRWHKVDINEELFDQNKSNHRNKAKINNYSA